MGEEKGGSATKIDGWGDSEHQGEWYSKLEHGGKRRARQKVTEESGTRKSVLAVNRCT